ncbi:hypothetical protein [Legionella sp. CNM-4043-24]|uniref:hypothetical protein n=1 Tax=Legionella sp. CNM-4043-24 TaxID=3421646 RepID=UPI00403A9DE6
MKLFTAEAAKLRAWKKKLQPIQSNRQQLKSELISLLSNEDFPAFYRWSQFNRRRAELLHGNHHHQGFYWTPSFNWFYSLLNALTRGHFVRKKKGSRLREALADDIHLDTRLLSLNDYELAGCDPVLTDKQFEKALFESPELALGDIKTRLTANDNHVNALIERVHALKYRLDTSTYEYLLSQLFQKHPAQAALYFYRAGKLGHYDTPADNDFIELNLLVHTLMQHFIRNTANIHLHNHNIIYLLSLISISSTPALQEAIAKKNKQCEADPFLKLLINWNDSGRAGFSAYDDLYDALQTSTYSQLTDAEQSNRQAHQLTFQTTGKSPFQILIDCWNLYTPQKSPLLVHIARQSLEQLFSDYFSSPEDETWNHGHSGYEAISFITRRMVNTSLRNDVEHFGKHLYDQWEAAMTTLGFVPAIPSSFRFAEYQALSLIKAINQNRFLDGARSLRTQNSGSSGLDASDLNWIMIRISRIDKSLLPALKHILYDTRVYDQSAFNELLSHPSMPVTGTLEDSIEMVRAYLTRAKEAALSLNSGHENASVELALVGISHCLHNDRLNSESIELLVNECLPKLQKHYITDDLFSELSSRFSQRQASLLRWDSSNIPDVHLECVNAALLQAQDYLYDALAEKSSFFQRSFCKEREYSGLAVACFSHYMSNPSPTTRDLARTVLMSMKPYLTPECFREWNQALSPSARISMASSGSPSLFYHKQTDKASTDLTHHVALSSPD